MRYVTHAFPSHPASPPFHVLRQVSGLCVKIKARVTDPSSLKGLEKFHSRVQLYIDEAPKDDPAPEITVAPPTPSAAPAEATLQDDTM